MRVLLIAGFVAGCSAGEEGPPGPQGLPGERGSDGAPGSQGERGPLGPQGDRGSRGDEGTRGETGERGERGEQGVVGPVGPMGLEGPAGPRGADGTSCIGESIPDGMLITCGEETLTLRHGEDGEPGPPGPMGLQGPPGPAGNMGPRGERGGVGPQGEQGLEWSPGRDGVSCTAQDVLEGIQISCGDVSVLIRHGEQGQPGRDGEPGLQGPEGPAGRDGQNLVANCPEDAKPLEMNGQLIYCARRLVFEEPQTYAQCYASCMSVGLYLVDTDDLIVICLSDPDFFADEIIDAGEGGVAGTCGDWLDNDADGRIDCADDDCAGSVPACVPGNKYHITYRPGEPSGTPGCITRYDQVCRGVERNISQNEFINWGFWISEPWNPTPRGCLCGKRL